MNFREYLRLMGRLYFQAGISNFSAPLLRRFGGVFVVAAGDVEHIRIDPDSWFGMQRNTDDRWRAARAGWVRHTQTLEGLLRAGRTPNAAIYEFMHRHQTTPHTPRQMQAMLQPDMLADGSQSPHWMVPTIRFRARLERGGRIMGDTFGAITTMVALAMTANDWQHATPAEWDRALTAGEIGIALGQMAGAHSDAHAARGEAQRRAVEPTGGR